jgi:hypothetical protein
MKTEQSSVVFRVPDFIDADGIEYTDIEVNMEMDGDIRSTAHLAETLQRPVKGTPMSKAGKRKVRTAMTTEQVARKLAQDVKEMSAEEKAKLRDLMDKEFKRVPRLKNMDGYADAARKCAAEEAAMLNYDEKGKPVN